MPDTLDAALRRVQELERMVAAYRRLEAVAGEYLARPQPDPPSPRERHLHLVRTGILS